jgi:hypothetical protein
MRRAEVAASSLAFMAVIRSALILSNKGDALIIPPGLRILQKGEKKKEPVPNGGGLGFLKIIRG